jgi:hypothetical protein
MVCTQVLVLPQSSVAVHVREIVDSCGHAPGVTTSVDVIVTDGSQLSVPVAVPVFAGSVLAVHSIVVLDGHVMVGATLSMTVNVWTQVAVAPVASSTVYVRVMTSGLLAHPVPPLVISVLVMVNVLQYSTTVTTALFGAGTAVTQLKVPPSAGGHATISSQQPLTVIVSKAWHPLASVTITE